MGRRLSVAVLAVVASPLTPIGTARIAEPHPGIAVDGAALALGVVATIMFFVAAAAIPLWRATSRRATAA